MQNLDIGVLETWQDTPERRSNINPIFSVKAQMHFFVKSGQVVYFDPVSRCMTMCELRLYPRCLRKGLNLPPSVSCIRGSEIFP